ncbi:hypothetical protein H9L10_03580 [Phycicoccus endophyticus]|uniref:Uncharacterized protein n=1 Tax=Phycicoccus endophyticus TaxID=1690220 RepID=A0A7G9R3H5_9MICO|nr:hypothetical protein [Phycicoccus endophyticus]NHI19906.1 hypothetical protein [Phycicoccus endophyticus]QNN50150.1 hypothetical protein H9L10_03580 [Phycicoccus endophyticus]GGL27606.1 hypothetical protein GCM10012283_07270 [Phycicoccus endophyticus]
MHLYVTAALAVILAGAFALRWWTWRPLVKRRAVVQLDDGTSFEGAVMSRRGPLLVMTDVTARVPGGEQRIDGTVVLERPRVVFVQVI